VKIENKFYNTYFPKMPYCRYFSETAKESFELNVNRISAKSKTTDLLEKSEELIIEMKHAFKLMERYKKMFVLKIVAERFNFWQDLTFYIVIFFFLLKK
jgi:hypothetical protein